MDLGEPDEGVRARAWALCRTAAAAWDIKNVFFSGLPPADAESLCWLRRAEKKDMDPFPEPMRQSPHVALNERTP